MQLDGTMRLRFSIALLLGAVACSAESDPDRGPTRDEEALSNFKGQVVAILPFDATNPKCTDERTAIDRTMLVACTALDPKSMPETVEITTSTTKFDPRRPDMVLVLRSSVGREAIVGFGPVPAKRSPSEDAPGGLLTKNAEAVRPRFGLIAAGAGGGALVAGPPGALVGATGGALATLAGVALVYWAGTSAATFVADRQELWDSTRAEPLVRETEQSILLAKSIEQLQGKALEEAKSDEKLRNTDTRLNPSNGFAAAAACIDEGYVVTSVPAWGYGPTPETAGGQAIENAANLADVPASLCKVIVICQRVGPVLDCAPT